MSGQPVMQRPPNQSIEIFLARLQAGAELCPPVDSAGQLPLRRLHSHLLATVTAALLSLVDIQPGQARFRHIVYNTVNMAAAVVHQVCPAGIIAARDMKDQPDIPHLACHNRLKADVTFLESLYVHIRTISEIVHSDLPVFKS